MTLRELGIVNAESREDGVRQAQAIMQTLRGTVQTSALRSLLSFGGSKSLEFDGSTGDCLYTNGQTRMQFHLTDIADVEEYTKTHYRHSHGRRIPESYEDFICIHVNGEKLTFPLRIYRLMKDEHSFNSGYSDIEAFYRLLMLYKYCRSHNPMEQGVRAVGQTGLPQSPSALPKRLAASGEPDPTVLNLPEGGGMPEL